MVVKAQTLHKNHRMIKKQRKLRWLGHGIRGREWAEERTQNRQQLALMKCLGNMNSLPMYSLRWHRKNPNKIFDLPNGKEATSLTLSPASPGPGNYRIGKTAIANMS